MKSECDLWNGDNAFDHESIMTAYNVFFEGSALVTLPRSNLQRSVDRQVGNYTLQ